MKGTIRPGTCNTAVMHFPLKFSQSRGLYLSPKILMGKFPWRLCTSNLDLLAIKFSSWVDRDKFGVWGVRSKGGSFCGFSPKSAPQKHFTERPARWNHIFWNMELKITQNVHQNLIHVKINQELCFHHAPAAQLDCETAQGFQMYYFLHATSL